MNIDDNKLKNNKIIKNNNYNHYFIGTIINNSELISKLNILQNVLKNKRFYISKSKYFKNFYSGFIYLGYIKEEIALKLKNYLNPLLISIVDNIEILDCEFNSINYNEDTKSINLYYNCYLISDVIIPFLFKYGINNLLNTKINKNINTKLFISLIKIDEFNNENKFIENLKTLYLPKNKNFIIQSIDIFSGLQIEDNIKLISSYPIK